MAPEQFDGVEADRRTDIFAFGAVVHEMITGKKTFEGKSQVLLISAIATAVPQPVSRVQPSAPPALDHVIKTCLEKDPANRWQDARDLLAELQWIADGGEEAGFSVSAAAGRPKRRWIRLAALGAARCWSRHWRCPRICTSKARPNPRNCASASRATSPRNRLKHSPERRPGSPLSVQATARSLRTDATSCFVPGRPPATRGPCICARSGPSPSEVGGH